MPKAIVVNSKEISLIKSITKADYTAKTVLTSSAWQFVELWLKRNHLKNKEALFYWQQARHFFDASNSLPLNSKPLTSYYCCLNAAKALLSINGISVENISHGITQDRRNQSKNTSLERAEVIFLGAGVLTELSKYLEEDVSKQTYTVKSLLYNIPCVHRAFSITYRNSSELFIPIRSLKYVKSDTQPQAWIQFEIDPRYAKGTALKYLPGQYEHDPHASEQENKYIVRKKNHRIPWDIHEDKVLRFQRLSDYHKKVRKDLHYIYGDSRLWYVKKNNPVNRSILKRNSLTLIFAVMHWLSELVRYNPMQFEKYMQTNQNWLLNEFIETALFQFVDEISCEIAGLEIMTPTYRK